MGELEAVERVHFNCGISSLDASDGNDTWQSVEYTAKDVIRCKCAGCKLAKNLLFPKNIEFCFTVTYILRCKGEMRDGTPASKLKVICEVEKSGRNGGKLWLSFFTRMLSSKNDIKVRVVGLGRHKNE